MKPVKPGDRLRVVATVPAIALAHYRAPFTGGIECELPPGTLLEVSHSKPSASGFSCVPEDYFTLEALLIPEEERESDTYDGFHLVVEKEEIGKRIETMPPKRPVQNREDFVAGTLRLFVTSEGGVDFPIPNGWISGLLRFDEELTRPDALFGCEVRFPGRKALHPEEEGPVEIRTLVDPEDYPQRFRPGERFDFWYGRNIGEGVIERLVAS